MFISLFSSSCELTLFLANFCFFGWIVSLFFIYTWFKLNNSNLDCTKVKHQFRQKLCYHMRINLSLKGLWHASVHVRHQFLFWRTFFQDWLLVKKSSSIDPETPEKAIISVSKGHLVHFGSFKSHNLYYCASIVEKIESHWGEVHEAMFVVVSVPTNGSGVACNVVIWLSFLSIKFLSIIVLKR